MIDKLITDSLKQEDIILCLRPTVVNGDEWSGDVNVSIMAGRDNPLNDESYYSFLHFAKMVGSAVPIMEKSDELRELINHYVLDEIDVKNKLDVQLENSDRGKVLDRQDNVVTVSFGSKTKGSA